METGKTRGRAGAGYAAGRPARSSLYRRTSAPGAVPGMPETRRAAPEQPLGHDASARCAPAAHPRMRLPRASRQITGRQGRRNRFLRCRGGLILPRSTLTRGSALLFLLLSRFARKLFLFPGVMIVGFGHGLSIGVANETPCLSRGYRARTCGSTLLYKSAVRAALAVRAPHFHWRFQNQPFL